MNKQSFVGQVEEQLGWRLSKLGEKWGLEWLTYNPLTFRHFHRVAAQSAPSLVRAVTALMPEVRKVVDVGAGSGAYAAEFSRSGIAAMACEHNPQGRRMARRQGVSSVDFDLTRTPPATITGPFDLAYSIEVAEHLPPALGDRIVEFMAGLAPKILFSAAHPGQEGHGHINEQPVDYWVERFEKKGYLANWETTNALREMLQALDTPAWWLQENAVVFIRNAGHRRLAPRYQAFQQFYER